LISFRLCPCKRSYYVSKGDRFGYHLHKNEKTLHASYQIEPSGNAMYNTNTI